MSDKEPSVSPSILERHIQTVLTGLLLAGVIWIASSVNTLQQNVAVLEVQVRATNEKVSAGTANRFDSNDAAAQLEIRDLKIERLEDRVERLEAVSDQ
jgi:outer membrane murein-binding lipoprotein Lpp